MKPSPIHVTEYFVTEASFSANRKFDPKQDVMLQSDDFQLGVEAQASPDNKRRWQIVMRLQHQPPAEANVPYRFTVEVVGFFVVLERYPEERVDRLVRTNGSSMLYGILREMVRDLTARGPYAQVMLPTTNFYEPEPAEAAESSQQGLPEKAEAHETT